jgi:hypothetical protein
MPILIELIWLLLKLLYGAVVATLYLICKFVSLIA